MTYFWASALPVFLPVVLLLAAHWAARPPRGLWFYVLTSVAALGAGIVTSRLLPSSQVVALGLSIAQVVLLLVFLLWRNNRSADVFWQLVFIALAAMQWGASPALMTLSQVHVVNTDLLLNLASIVTVLVLCLLLAALLCAALRLAPRLRWPLLLATVVVMLVPISGNILLSLMKLQMLELTGLRLTYAARTTKFASDAGYALLAIVILFAVIGTGSVLLRLRSVWQRATDLISSRIALAGYRRARSIFAGTAVIACVMLAGNAYWDVIGSRPPQLSAASRVALAGDDTLRLPMTPLMDGNLHRFAWVADDGKVVRFFVINRLAERVGPGVVFDACLLCGDKGYIQEGDQVVCVGCGVHLYKPTIGKPGGCNPVPIENWTVVADTIVIPKASLEAGLQLFSTVLTIDVTDPVSGRKLTNTGAAHRYTHDGRTYFFADDEAFKSFRDDPDRYIRRDVP